MELSKRSSRPASPANLKKRRYPSSGAEDLYKELRIENTLTDERGTGVHLKQGDAVGVIIEAEPQPPSTTTESKD